MSFLPKRYFFTKEMFFFKTKCLFLPKRYFFYERDVFHLTDTLSLFFKGDVFSTKDMAFLRKGLNLYNKYTFFFYKKTVFLRLLVVKGLPLVQILPRFWNKQIDGLEAKYLIKMYIYTGTPPQQTWMKLLVQ